MLSNKARYRIFGLALESVFETGDFFDILHSIQSDDQDLAIFTCQIKWKRIKKIIIDVGAWVTRYEAAELVGVFMKSHAIKNQEIWSTILDTDVDLHLFQKNVSLDDVWQERQNATPERKKELDRLTVIRAILNTYMLETKIMQDSEFLKRLDVIFPQELQIVVNKMKSYQIRCTWEELTELVGQEFPNLPKSYLNYIKKYFQQILAGYSSADFELPSQIRSEDDSLEDEFDCVFGGALIDDTIVKMQTREPEVSLTEDNQSLVINLAGKEYEITVESISNLLIKMIDDYGLEEIYDRATDQLRTFRKHARDQDQLETFWLILERVEKLLQAQWSRDEESLLMNKIGKLINCLAIFKTGMGNDIALLCSLKMAKK